MSGAITFKNYPSTNRVPGAFAEFDNSQANSGTQTMRALLIGQMTAAGTATAGVAEISAGLGDAQAKYGLNSMLAQQLQMYRLNDTFGEVWCLPLADAAAGTAASGTITPTGPATSDGTISLYIAASPINPVIPVVVTSGMTAIEIGTAIAAAINALTTAPVTAAADAGTGVVTLTAIHKGEVGNAIDMRINYRGAAAGEALPGGVTIAFAGTASGAGTLLTGGATNPIITAALAGLAGDTTFDFILQPYTDAVSAAAMTEFLGDTAGRWSWQQQLYGGAWSAFRGSLGTLAAFGQMLNDQHLQVVGVYDMPTPEYLVAADVMSVCAISIRANPAIPLQYLALQSYAAPLASRFTLSERNTLLYDGISTIRVQDSGAVETERLITTYQKNAAGAADDSYLDTETLYCLQFMARDMEDYLLTQFPNAILVVNGTSIPYGSKMTTPNTVLATANARYNTYCSAGIAQDAITFAKNSKAVAQGRGTVALFLPFNVADQLRDIPMLIQFLKS